MTIRDSNTLKSYFDNGDVPTEQNYWDLIDTIFGGAGSGLVPHAPTHKYGGVDEVAVIIPDIFSIPMSGADGKLDVGWIPDIQYDHGGLSGREDDDHEQYLNIEQHDLMSRHPLGVVVEHDVLNYVRDPNDDTRFNLAEKLFTLDVDSGEIIFSKGSDPTLKITGQVESKSISPFLTDTYDLGSSTKLWRKGWLSEIDAVLFAQNTNVLLGGWFTVSKGEGVIDTEIPLETGSHTYVFPTTANIHVYDFLVFRSAGLVEYMQVTADLGSGQFTVDRNKDGTGANVWPAGSVFANFGYAGAGRIELNAYDTPRLQFLSQGSTYNSQTEQLRIGDLNGNWGYTLANYDLGVYDVSTYDNSVYGPRVYGIAMGEYASNMPNITIDPDNGLRIRSYSSTVMQFDTLGNADITGKLRMPELNSAISIGEIPPLDSDVGTGIWLDRTGLYGLKNDVIQAKLDAVTGAITGGGGTVVLDADGLVIHVDEMFLDSTSIRFLDFLNQETASFRVLSNSGLGNADMLLSIDGAGGSNIYLTSDSFNGGHVTLSSHSDQFSKTASLDLLSGGFSFISAIADGFTISGSFACNGASAQTPKASGGAVNTSAVDATYGTQERDVIISLRTLVDNIRTALVNNGIMS